MSATPRPAISSLSDASGQPAVLNPIARVIGVFTAPARTFADVKRSSGWWMPFLIAVVVSLIHGYTVLHKVGLADLTAGIIHQSSSLEDRLAGATPEAAAQIRHIVEIQLKVTLYAGPVFSLIFGLIGAGILLASANFIAGGRATYSQMLGVWFYGSLPLVVFYMLVIVAVFAGVGGDSFDLKNEIGTNIGFYLAGGETPKWLVALLGSIDVFAIWAAYLLTIGVATVAGIKRGSAAAIVLAWWGLGIVIKVVAAASGN